MFNTKPEQHEMYLEKRHETGDEEWVCPTCGRRFIMQYHPLYQKLDLRVLKAGNEAVSHVGSKGGISMGKTQVSKRDEEPILSEDMQAALDEALKDIDFNDSSGPVA